MAIAKLKTKRYSNKKLNLSQIRRELDDLENIRTIVTNFEDKSMLHKKKTLKSVSNFELPMKLKSLNSEIKEYEEVNERLESLSFNLGLMRTTLLTRNHQEAIRISKKFITSDYSNIGRIVDEINSFHGKIKELDSHYKQLIGAIPTNLEFKTDEETSYENHISSLKQVHITQKVLMKNIGNLFLDLTKRIIKENKEKI